MPNALRPVPGRTFSTVVDMPPPASRIGVTRENARACSGTTPTTTCDPSPAVPQVAASGSTPTRLEPPSIERDPFSATSQ